MRRADPDGRDLVSRALARPEDVASWPADERSRLLVQARSAGLLGRLAALSGGSGAAWPDGANGHIDAARRVTGAHHREVRREVELIHRALRPLGAPVVLLKGAAYVMAGLPAAEGRVFSDIDIMLPRPTLPQAESLLMLAGWMGTPQTAYDERYYREWMHELPPMEHVHRGTTLDVHHTILPLTARLRPDAARLLEDAVELPDHPGLRVLAPADMVLHAVAHLFANEELSHALRDLSDIDRLLRHFAARDPAFWDQLLDRASLHGLTRLASYAAHHASERLETPVPARVLEALRRHEPAFPLRPLMHGLWRHALRPPHPSAAHRGRSAAMFALYVRGHALRMPPRLLVQHLAVKAVARWRSPNPQGDMTVR